jgi:hypothetical protein
MSVGPKFFQTRMGQRFYEVDVPNAVKALNRLADAVAQRQSPPAPSVQPSDGKTLAQVFNEDEVAQLRAALRLVQAIADYPERNPGETVILAPKTRAQINKALCMSMKKTAAEVFSDVEEGDF